MDLATKMDTSNPQTWVNSALGGAAALFAWFLRKYVAKVDKIESEYVSRSHLEAALTKRDAALATMHEQNLANFRELRLQNETANGRLFDIAKNMVPRS